MSAPARTSNYFQNLSLVFSKMFDNNIGPRERRQYHFETYFGHKGYEKARNQLFPAKFPLSSEISIWCAVLASARTCNSFQNLSLMFSKLFDNHVGVQARRQYHFEKYFGNKGYEKAKNRHFHAKCRLSPELLILRAVSAPESYFMII